MGSFENAVESLIICVALPLFCGLAAMVWGRRLPRQGDWLGALGILAMLAGVAFGWNAFIDRGGRPDFWLRGWFWPKSEDGAVLVGIFEDGPSLVLPALAALLSAAFLMNLPALKRESRPERLYAAAALSSAGTALSWLAVTPWFCFMGLGITIFGGVISLGSRWEADADAALAARFAWERSWGLVLAIVGTAILSSTKAPLTLLADQAWGAQGAPGAANAVGAALLVVGLFVQMQPFPLLGWAVSPSQVFAPGRTLFSLIFPAWSAFALLVRLEPQLRSLGLFPVFGWVALISSVAAVGSGFFQAQWRSALGATISAGLALAVGVLAFTGPAAALTVMVGVSLGGLAIAVAGTALEEGVEGGAANDTHRKRAKWAKAAIFLAAASATGTVGFASSGGLLRWVAQAWAEPGQAALFAFVVFLVGMMGWKLAWSVARINESTQASWVAVLSPLLLVLLATGAVWTGTASGGVIPGDDDRLFSSLIGILFGDRASVADPSALLAASWLYWGALGAGIAAAYWTAGRRDLWSQLSLALPRFSAFLSGGYGVDTACARALEGVKWVGSKTEWLLEGKIWQEWILDRGMVGVKLGGVRFARAVDDTLSERLAASLRQSVEVPAKILQLIQSGDVQWYLLFAIGSGIAILVHFLRA